MSSIAERLDQAIDAYEASFGRHPTRVVWALDIQRAAMEEARAGAGTKERDYPLRFVTSRRVPPGMMFVDDRETDDELVAPKPLFTSEDVKLLEKAAAGADAYTTDEWERFASLAKRLSTLLPKSP